MRIRITIQLGDQPGARKIKEEHELPRGGDQEEFASGMISDYNDTLVGTKEPRRRLIKVESIVECKFCKKKMHADDLCAGCQDYVCSDCETEPQSSREHDVEDHNPGAEEEVEEEEDDGQELDGD